MRSIRLNLKERTKLSPMAGFVLAGGKSSRMGRDKARLQLGGKALLEHAIDRLGEVCEVVCIAGNRPDLAAYAPVIQDRYADCGPLGGIHAALLQSRHDWNIFLPVDVPLLPAAFLHAMAEAATQSHAVAVIAEHDGMLEPLCALYHRDLAPYLALSLVRKKFQVITAVNQAVELIAREREMNARMLVVRISAEKFAKKMGEKSSLVKKWFLNANTPREMATLERKWTSIQKDNP